MADIIQVRRDTAANWTSTNPVLASGEIGYETDTTRIKVGNGVTVWTGVIYYNGYITAEMSQLLVDAQTAESNASTSATNAQLEAWEAEAQKLTTDSYATRIEDAFVDIYTSNGNGTFTATPTIEYSTLHYAAKVNANAVQVAADLVQTNLDTIATAADVVATNQDTIDTAADLAATNQDTIDTAANLALTNADVVLTHADVVLTNADVVTVAGIYDQFDDRYLGSKSVAPTLDNDGNALLVGALHWNSVADSMYVWSGAEWVSAGASVIDTISQELVYTATGGQTVFSGADDNGLILLYDTAASILVYLNGAKLVPIEDYTLDSIANSVTLTVAADLNDELGVVSLNYLAAVSLEASNITNEASGNITSTTVQLAINELDTDIAGLATTVDGKAPLTSPSLTGVPTAPTAATATNDTQIASTAFTRAAITAYAPAGGVPAGNTIGSVVYGSDGSTNTTARAVGYSIAGSSLRWTTAGNNTAGYPFYGTNGTYSLSLTGTWACLTKYRNGQTTSPTTVNYTAYTMWVRIS